MKAYTRKEFMEAAGINNRQRLSQLMKGCKNKRNGKIYITDPVLIEGVDYVKQKIIFFESALEKLKAKKQTT